MRVVIQRHFNGLVAHDILQRLGTHASIGLVGTEGVTQQVRRERFQLLFVLFVVLL